MSLDLETGIETQTLNEFTVYIFVIIQRQSNGGRRMFFLVIQFMQ